ncbi:glycine receptor subunit alpha-4-like isoform X1 [Macrobrachium nipponense]|uniref:glycine receptor subunit alpha-4-like isoform X1 n=1 Tax=Macrobrachium nipponense TaxID=159736 RepID=UPI0030C7AF43
MTRHLTGAAVLSLCLALRAVVAGHADDDCHRFKEQELQSHPFLASIIPCTYVKEYRPPTERGKPVQVEFTMYIQDINSINAADMDFRIDLFLHMTWEDPRLNLTRINFVEGRQNEHDYITLPAYAIDYIWTPDPYVTNSKDSAITKLTTTYASLTLYRNHTIRYSARVYSIIGCQMEFREYPMDVQTCHMIFQSFMHSHSEVAFQWRKWSPVMINKELKLLQFSLEQPLKNYVRLSEENEHGDGTRNTQQLVVELEFSREIGHHIVQTFVPSFLVVTLSWFSFWLGLEAIPGRVTLLVTSLLTLTTLFTGIKEGLPPVAYVKAIDVWMAGCMVFVFAALGEFVVVRVLNVMHVSRQVEPVFPPPTPVQPIQTPSATAAKADQRSDYLRRVAMTNGTADNEDKAIAAHNNKVNQAMNPLENGSIPCNLHTRSRSAWDAESAGFRRPNGGRFSLAWNDPKTGEKKILWKEIDKASRIVFPLMFLLFMSIYFPILLSRAF